MLVAKLEKTERRRDCGKDALGFGDLFPIGGDDILISSRFRRSAPTTCGSLIELDHMMW